MGERAEAQPDVSLVLPVHNGADHLAESLGSLCAQTFDRFELIVIDDGSTDATGDILADWSRRDPRLRVIAHEKNLGLIASLNRGFREARGGLLARQDADDVSLSTRLAAQVEAFRTDPDLGVLGTSYIRFRSDGSEARRDPATSHTELRWRLLFENVWCHSSIMLRRDSVPAAELEFREFLHAEDFELWGRLLRHTRGRTLPEALVRYREHGEAVSARNEGPQRAMVAEVSRVRLGEILGRTLSVERAAGVGQLWRGRLPDGDAGRSTTVLLEAFHAFRALPDVDPTIVDRLRDQWVRRLLATSAAAMIASSGGRHALRVLSAHLPGALARGAASRLRAP